MLRTIAGLEQQLALFANQRLILHLRRQKRQLEQYRLCERRARELVSHLEVLSQLETPGRLSPENRKRLTGCGASILDQRELNSVMELDVVTNYHVSRILSLRRELLEVLEES